MNLTEAISILKIHQEWRLGADIVSIEPKELTEAMQTIINLLDPEYIVGMTTNAWDLSFIRKLQIAIGDIQRMHNDCVADGFEQGAQWVWDNFKLEIK